MISEKEPLPAVEPNFNPLGGLADLASSVPAEIEALKAIGDVRSHFSGVGDNRKPDEKRFRQVVFAWFSLRVVEGCSPGEIKRLAKRYIDLATEGPIKDVIPRPVASEDRTEREQSVRYKLIKAIKNLIF